jgi:dipeptidyl aminopeptidase/acylaminoacyl peptidase
MGICRRLVLIFGLFLSVAGWAAEKRPLVVEDMENLVSVSSPAVSPDGKWVAHVASRDDMKEDESSTQIWFSGWDGSGLRQYTTAKESSSSPGFSPDSKWLALLSSRGREDGANQFCVMPTSGGEARCVTDLPGGVSDYDWAPDSRRVVLVSKVDPLYDPEADEDKKPEPIVIDRYLDKGETVQLTDGAYQEFAPAFSPDGKRIAFTSKRGADPDTHDNWDVFVMDAQPGAEARSLTTNPGVDAGQRSRPQWSPDGKQIAYVAGGDPALLWYSLFRLAVVPTDGGQARLLTADLDRNVSTPRWSEDGKSLYFLLEDDQSVQLARMPAAGGKIIRLTAPGQVISDVAVGSRGVVLLTSSPAMPYELQVLEGSGVRQLTRHNAWLDKVALAAVKAVSFKSADGTEVHGLLMSPVTEQQGAGPGLLRLHGGPVSQRQFEFEFEFQVLAAQGYTVIAPNFRGSTGRGEIFQRAIFADWGNVEMHDALAAADYLVENKLVDSQRLGVYGWSYGGILTNYVIASDTRFRAAISGASMSNMLGGYGIDHYIREWNAELGAPWEHLDTWLKLSYPFLHADRIKTPTLFVVGELDYNVPLPATQQMYQALRQLGVETEMVVYPGEHHGISRPSFNLDRMHRYIDWFASHLGETTSQ